MVCSISGQNVNQVWGTQRPIHGHSYERDEPLVFPGHECRNHFWLLRNLLSRYNPH